MKKYRWPEVGGHDERVVALNVSIVDINHAEEVIMKVGASCRSGLGRPNTRILEDAVRRRYRQ